MNRQPDLEEEEDSYRESEDEDYNPDKAVDEDGGVDEDEEDEEDRQLDAAYSQYQGRGGLIKTRAQRRAEAAGLVPKDEADTKPAPVVGQESIDVDALWKEMNTNTPPSSAKSTSETSSPASKQDSRILTDEYILITRTFKFAGEVKTETKRVLKTSAEGQDYLREQERKNQNEQQSESSNDKVTSDGDKALSPPEAEDPRQAIKRQGRQPVKRKMSLMEEYKMNKAKKINTLEKSRLDWLGFVDKEGIREDLTKHNKSGYLDKQSFLEKVDEKLDHDVRQQRAKRMNQ